MEASLVDAGMPAWNAHALAQITGTFSTGKYAYTTDTVANLLKREPTTHVNWLSGVSEAFK